MASARLLCVFVPEVWFSHCCLLAPQLVTGYLVWAGGEVAEHEPERCQGNGHRWVFFRRNLSPGVKTKTFWEYFSERS